MSYKQRTGQAGFSNDSNGYKVDHRSETERRSESKETKKLQDGHEIHKQETRVINLEELKSRETSRIATAEDVRALLEAEFEGIREIQTSREISVEEFNLIESQFRKKLGSKVDCQTEFKEEHKLENVLESPQWKTQFGMPVFTKNEIFDVREATVVEKNYPDPQLSKVSSGNVSLHKSSQPGAESGTRTTVTTDYPEGSLRHEAKQKRHVMEEVFIEDSDKFYEKTSPKKSRRDDLDYIGGTEATVQVRGLATSRDDDVTLREHNRHLMEVDAPTATPRKKRTTQSELVVEDTNLFTDETQRHSMFNQDYKIKPMYPEKSKALTNQDVDVYFVKEQSKGDDKENTSNVTSRTGPQQEIVVGEIGTFREGTLDTEKNRSVEKIDQEAFAGKSKGFKKRLNQKDIKLIPKLRHRQEEIVINDPTVYDETQFLSLRKAQKKKRLFENTKTLPAKFGKKSKTQMGEVDLILKKSEEIAEGKHITPLSDVPEQVVLDEPDVFREATSVKKKQNVSHSSLEKQQKQLEKMEREFEARALENSEFGKQKGPQEEIIIDDPEVFRETTLKRKKQEKAPPNSKIMKDIMQDIDVLTQEARKSGSEEKYLKMDELDSIKFVEKSKPHQKELVLEDGTVYKENTLNKSKPIEVTSESKVVDETSVIKHSTDKHQGELDVDQDKTVTEVVHKKQDHEVDTSADLKADKALKSESIHHAQPELVVDDRTLFSDHNKPKDIHLEHGKAIQMAEIDDFDLPELDKPAEKQISETKPEKTDKKSGKPKKPFFKKKKKSQGESVVDESFVYEDAAKIRVPEVSKKEESEAKVSGPSSGKTFWNWNFGQHKAQQEVIKDESHYHEDKPEDDVQKQPEVMTEHTHEIEEGTCKKVTTIQPPINFQDSNVDVEIKETPADLKILQESSHKEILELPETKPDQMKIDVSTVVISKPDVVKVDETQKILSAQEESKNVPEVEKEETDVKEATKEKHKFKINLPSFPKPHFGHKKQQESATDEKLTVVESVDAKIKVEPLQVTEEKTSTEVRIGSDVDSGIPQKEVVREQETIAVEETQKSVEVSQSIDPSEKIDQGEESKDVKQSKPDSHKSKFHFPSFTIPKPHINFGFKKHQPEAVDAAKIVVVEESKVDETTTKDHEKKADDKDLALKEKTIIQEDVFVEETHDIEKETGVAKEQSQLEGEKSLPESNHADESKKDDDKSHEKFKIHLPHIPKPHLNIHFNKDKDVEQKSEINHEKETEEEEVKEDVKTDKFKFTVPHINLHVPHIHFASANKQEEVVVDEKEVISDSSKVLVAEDNPKDKLDNFTIETEVSADSQPFETPEKTESMVTERSDVIEKLPQQEVVETDAIQVSEEKVEVSKKEPVKESGTLEEKDKKKMKFNFPHFSLPRSHGKQAETVTNEALVVEDSTKLKLTEKKVDDVSDEHSEEASVDKDEVDKEKKSDNKFKFRLPKPHFKFGFKSKEKQKPEEIEKEVTDESVPVVSDSKELKVETSDKGDLKTKQEEEQKVVQPAFLTQPCSDEFTETIKYVLDAGEEVPSGPMTIKVDPDEYKVLISKHKPVPKDVDESKPSEEIIELKKEAGIQLPQVVEPQVAVCVPYYEYEPNGNEDETDVPESKPSKTDAGETTDANASEQPKPDRKQLPKPDGEQLPKPDGEQLPKLSDEKLEPEIVTLEKQEKDVPPKSKSKFHFPCIKLKKPFLKKCEDAEPGSEDDPAYGEVSTEEMKEDGKQLEGKPVYEKVGGIEDNKLQTSKSDKTSKKKHQVFKSPGKKSAQDEIVVNDAHIYTDNSTLGRRLLNKFRHKDKVAPESGAFIVENDLPESAESKLKGDQEADEQVVVASKQATLETEASTLEKHQPESSTQPTDQQVIIKSQDDQQVEAKVSLSDDGVQEADSSTLESSKTTEKGLKHKKQDELIVGGGSIITEPQTSPIHKALHKLGKSNEQINAQSNQEMYESEKVIKRKEHGKLTSLFHRSSGEYDLDHQKRTNQPLVELISSRSKPAEEFDASVSAQEENSWSLNYRKNLTLDATNHLTFESEYDPDQSVFVENIQLFCPTARRSYRKQVQIDDFDLLKTINETGSFKTSTPKKAEGASDGTATELVEDNTLITPSKASTSAVDPVKWTSSQAKNTSYFSTLPEFATVDDQQKSPHFVVVAIDFGTTFSGYAFSFKNDVDSIHIMRKWEGGDPGVVNQKTPTTLLLTPDKEFHSFGFTARDFYHDLSPKEAKKWLYFEKFKMALHYNADLSSDTEIQAANGTSVKAQDVFAYALRFFKNHAVQEISEQTGTELIEDDVKWVITVPAIWKAPAKQFMREAAYKAGIASEGKPDQLLIALEPEAASIFVRKQRLRQLIPEEIDELKDSRTTKSNQDLRPSSPVLIDTIAYQTQLDESASWSQSVASNALSMSFQRCPSPTSFPVAIGHEIDITDNRFMVADCGGGTVDITVYDMLSATGGKLKELYKASGGPYGSIGVDLEFEKLLVQIFSQDFIDTFKVKRPAGWVDLMMAFESRKRAANPFKTKPLNVSLPFSFIDYFKKFKNATVESAIRKYNNKDVKWSSQGMMRLMPECMNRLFQPTLDSITEAIANVLNQPGVSGVRHIFLVGGFAESPMLQQEIRKNFAHQARILIPTDVSLTILKGAVLYGIDPSIVVIRKSRLTYGLGVLNRFVEGKHPESKKAMKDGVPWCVDVFDHLVLADQSVALGSSVIRSYTPAGPSQKFSLFHIYCTEKRDVDYVTDEGVVKCGTLRLDLDDYQWELETSPSRPVSQNLQDVEATPVVDGSKRREIQARLTFGDTEIKIIALDVATGNYVRATLDFLNK